MYPDGFVARKTKKEYNPQYKEKKTWNFLKTA
jgi:hypothetical protein